MYPITGWPKDVFPMLVQLVNSIVNQKSVKEFYIGRGRDPSERKSYHGSVDNSIAIESALIDTFYNHQKCNNKAQHGGGGVSEEYGNYVYVAIWF